MSLGGLGILAGIVSLLIDLSRSPRPVEARVEVGVEPSNEESSPVATPDLALGKAPGQGFVVWESNRSGKWRLWRRELDGSGLRQVTSQEGDLNHCCAHISPDGANIAYLRYRPGQRRPGAPPPTAALHILSTAEPPNDRVLDPEARLLSEQRIAVWRSPHQLLYVDSRGHTQLLDFASGRSRQLTLEPHLEDGWLMNPTLSHATAGWPTFSPYDAQSRQIAERRKYGGCQPYFSHDGRWGFWVAGAGGPLHRIDLSTRNVETLLGKNDSRMPRGQGYLYFPMLSPGGDLLAFAASPDEHDFRTSNYDIFIVETDPDTLRLLGDPIRYTLHPETDRFPDVYRAPQELGRHSGEAPFRLRLEPPGTSGTWDWDFGDGTFQSSTGGDHTYERPGRYELEARQEDQVLHGLVSVSEPRPPQPMVAELRGEDRIVITFDEAVRFESLELRLTRDDREPASIPAQSVAEGVRGFKPGRDGRSLVVDLDEPLSGGARLWLSGVLDRAQQANLMAPTEVVIDPPLWPSKRRGTVFLWLTGDSPNLVLVETSGVATERTYALTARGRARHDHHFAMRLTSGSFLASPDASQDVAKALRDTNQMTMELTLTAPAIAFSRGPLDIVSFSPARTERENFTLYQEGRDLYLRLRNTVVRLLQIPAEGKTHLAVTYSPGQLRVYQDGDLVLRSEAIQGDFFRFRPRPLTFGSSASGERDWPGTLEGIAIYDRVLAAGEVRENARRYHELVQERPQVPEIRLQAKLRRRSKVPRLDELGTYRQALVVFEYTVEEVMEGKLGTASVRVAHWAFLAGRLQEQITSRQPGDSYSLRVEPFEGNPQLEGLFMVDDLPLAPGLGLYYDVE